jgi:anti-anti-sigma regulatory factor
MSSQFLIGRCSEGILVRVVGRGTMRESPAFRDAVEPFLNSQAVVFDATECDYLDSTFLGCLISINKECEEPPRCRFVVVAPEARRNELFTLSSLHQYFHFVDVCPEVEGELVPIDISALAPEEMGMHVMKCHRRLADLGGPEAEVFRSAAERLAKELGVEPDAEPTTLLYYPDTGSKDS